jgi:nucleoside-diphosphate-sugar epimerase
MYLITGGSGFLGGLLSEHLHKNNENFISVDTLMPAISHAEGYYIIGDICDYDLMEDIFTRYAIDVVFHFATQIDFKVKNQRDLFTNNVRTTEVIAGLCEKYKIRKLIFTSSNSVYLGNPAGQLYSEMDTPIPIDEYGRAKKECEEILARYSESFDCVVFRCPNIMDAGRVGMLSLLFDFVREGRKCWMIGNGEIIHQCIYAQDLLSAMFMSLELKGHYTFNIGTDRISTIREMYESIIYAAKSKSRVVSLPSKLIIPMLKFLNFLHLSPLGVYQFRMLTQDFGFDITYIKSVLDWRPSLSNAEMFTKAYEYYVRNIELMSVGDEVSANRSQAKMGIIRIVKFFS